MMTTSNTFSSQPTIHEQSSRQKTQRSFMFVGYSMHGCSISLYYIRVVQWDTRSEQIPVSTSTTKRSEIVCSIIYQYSVETGKKRATRSNTDWLIGARCTAASTYQIESSHYYYTIPYHTIQHQSITTPGTKFKFYKQTKTLTCKSSSKSSSGGGYFHPKE